METTTRQNFYFNYFLSHTIRGYYNKKKIFSFCVVVVGVIVRLGCCCFCFNIQNYIQTGLDSSKLIC